MRRGNLGGEIKWGSRCTQDVIWGRVIEEAGLNFSKIKFANKTYLRRLKTGFVILRK
jgi:hypothetical protein